MAKRKSNQSKAKEVKIRQTNLGRFFYLTLGRFVLISVILIILVLLHNFSYELFKVEEPFLFLALILLISIYLVKAIIYTFVHRRMHGKKRL